MARVDGPWTLVYFLTPELTAWVEGVKNAPEGAFFDTRELGPSSW